MAEHVEVLLSDLGFQISNIDVKEYVDQRQNFTTDEWIDFLMHTVGLNPEKMNRREKFITLARLLPHVENNFNFTESEQAKKNLEEHTYEAHSLEEAKKQGAETIIAALHYPPTKFRDYYR